MAQPIITLYDVLTKDDNTTPHPFSVEFTYFLQQI